LYLTLIAFNEGNTSITCPVSGGELSITNGDDTVYDESPALFVACNGCIWKLNYLQSLSV